MAFAAIDLNKNNWQYREYPTEARTLQDLEEKLWYDAIVPGSIYLSLAKTGHVDINDLYLNPENYKWVEEKPWIYRTFFDVTPELAKSQNIQAVFNMLDTYACIWINGKLIGRTNNCFIQQRFDINEHIQPGQNSLMIKFEPCVETAKKTMEKYSNFEGDAFRHPYRVYARKPQYSFGWDFCPHLPGCGILDDVKIEFHDSARISNFHVQTIDCNQHYADVKVSLELENFQPKPLQCQIEISGTGMKIQQSINFNPQDQNNSVVFHIERPFLWWPKGYGIQYLYDLKITLKSNEKTIDTLNHKFGIRTVKLNQQEDEHGKSFQFTINGQPIKAKGANWIPISLLGGQTHDDYKCLLKKAQQANFNMLRVWGGGYYEKNIFYKLCDQYGILVWQDFMFACAQYPQHQFFLDTIANEAQAVIKRLRNFPSLALWCGNNECQWLHKKGEIGKNSKFIGTKIFDQLLPSIVQQYDTEKDYINTTPFDAGKDYENPSCGTIHSWNVWADNRDPIEYTKTVPRFVTEFGMQSLPDITSLSRYIPKEKLHVSSYQLEKINRDNFRTSGNTKLYHYALDSFSPTGDLDQLIYFSQLAQARAIKLYTEHTRAHSQINSGTLFWQFNDCFPAISWSCIDNFDNPKALYYYARRFYRPVLISLIQKHDRQEIDTPFQLTGGQIVIVNDLPTPITGQIVCDLCDMYGQQLDSISFPVRVGPYSLSMPSKLPQDFIKTNRRFDSYLLIKLLVEDKTYTRNTYLLTKDKYINWPVHNITIDYKQNPDNQPNLILKSDTFVKDLKIHGLEPNQLTDNYIDLIPNETFHIPLNQPDCEAAKKIQLLSVNSIYNQTARH